MRLIEDIGIKMNVELLMRERGKIVQGSRREGHNVFVVNGKNWLTQLMSWQYIAGSDVPYTNRRVRWMGMGAGTQIESPSVTALVEPLLATPTDYLRPIQGVTFPSSTAAMYTKEFGVNEITIAGIPVAITEVGLYVDVNPANNGAVNDSSYSGGNPSYTTLDPTSFSNPVIAYNTFPVMTKTVDFTVTVNWTLQLA